MSNDGPVPVACTLAPSEVADRVDDWQSLLARVTNRSALEGGLRLEFDQPDVLESATRLAVAEQDCCAFFSFAVTIDGRGLALEVRAPEGGQDVLLSLFGPPEPAPEG